MVHKDNNCIIIELYLLTLSRTWSRFVILPARNEWVALVICRKQDETGYGEQRRHAEVHGHVPVNGSERC